MSPSVVMLIRTTFSFLSKGCDILFMFSFFSTLLVHVRFQFGGMDGCME